MLSFSQPITPAAKAHMEAQLSMMTDMSQRIFQSAQQLNELNMDIAQSMMEESVRSAQQILSAEDPSEMISIAAAQAQPAAEKVRAYRQHLSNIAAGTQVELAKAAEDHVQETSRTAGALAKEVAQRASEETEKSTQRQKEAMEKLTNPIHKSSERGQSSAARKGA